LKGLVIIAAVLLGFAGGLFWLLRPSDRDLVRVEEDVARLLDESAGSLDQITLQFNTLRSIRPNLQGLRQELDTLRRQLDQFREEYRTLREERPAAKADHAPFLRRRQQLRTQADQLRQSTHGLAERVAVVDDFMRSTQPRIQVMKEVFLELFNLRRRLQQEGRKIDPDVNQKIDYLYGEKESLLALARSVINIGSQNAEQGRTIAASVAGGVERIIADAQALARILAAS